MDQVPNISLDQWRALVAVVERGGYAQAAEALHKSQSAVTYAVQKIESLLGVRAFEIHGRRAVLTTTGQMLYRRAQALVNEAADLERAAHMLSAGWEAEIRLAVELLFPSWLLLQCLHQFGQESPRTRVEVTESVMGGTVDALIRGQADIAIAPLMPPGFLGDPLVEMRLVAVAHADHPLHALGRPLTNRDLRGHRHVVARDSGPKRDHRTLTVDVEQRWTVGHISTSIHAVRQGYAFAWLPENQIEGDLASGVLKPLPLREGGVREVTLHLMLADPDCAGPGVLRMAALLHETVRLAGARAGLAPPRQREGAAAAESPGPSLSDA